MIKVAMFDTKQYDAEAFEKEKSENIQITYFETKLDLSTVSLANGFDCVIVFVNDNIDDKVIDALYSYGVKLIALRCAGFDNVDLKAAKGKISVCRVPAYSPNAVAEHAAALLLTSVRRIHKAYNRTREYNFSLSGFTGMNLCGKTVGVIGAGKIGRAFIDICKGFHMNVLVYDKFPDDSLGVDFVSLDELLANSDIISLHCPLTEENYHMISEENINKMKQGVIIINTSRGALIDTKAVLDGILSRKIHAVCLDVYEDESKLFYSDKSNHILQDDILARLLSMPNVIVTAHQAFLTKEALSEISRTTLMNIKNYFAGERMENEVSSMN